MMPPTKSGHSKSGQQPKIDTQFKSVRDTRSRRKSALNRGPFRHRDQDLVNLRYPAELCRNLPSVRKFCSMKRSAIASIKKEVDGKLESNGHGESSDLSDCAQVLGAKRRKGEIRHYCMQKVCETKMSRKMIWDMAFLNNSLIAVSHSEGVTLYDNTLQEISKLDKVSFGGGIDTLSDGRIVAVCRNFDTVNFFTPEGEFLHQFPAGFSPMGLRVINDENLAITDSGEKEIRVYNLTGQIQWSIAPKGPDYNLQWPLYLGSSPLGSLLVVDCHAQNVLNFTSEGKFDSPFPIATTPGNCVLRPHGIAIASNGDVFLIDTSIDSLEVFTPDGSFSQTLVQSEDGVSMRPKAVALNKEGTHLILGGRTGILCLFKFTDPEDPDIGDKKQFVGKTDDVIVLD